MKRTLKSIGLAFIGAASLLMVISLFLPGEIHVERTASIDAPKEAVFEKLNDIQQWKNWFTLFAPDEHTTLEYGQVSEGVGASFTWITQAKKQGEVTISKSQSMQLVELHALYPGKSEPSVILMALEQSGTSTNVTLSMHVSVGWSNIPGKFAGIFMDDVVGKDFEVSLEQLKTLCIEREH